MERGEEIQGKRPPLTLTVCSAVHFLHDGASDSLYVLFPLFASEFHLFFAQVGLLRTAYSGAMAGFQIPAGILAERWREATLLSLGTGLVAAGYMTLGIAPSFGFLLLVLVLSGLGSGVQHPISSSLVSKAFEIGPRRLALGTYNFSGDVGKFVAPALLGLLAGWIGWRWATRLSGAFVLLSAVGLLFVLGRLPEARGGQVPQRGISLSGWGIRDLRQFRALAAIGVIDQSTRTTLLTFLPFLLLAKGFRIAEIGVALALIFGGGAVGKFVCGAVAERLGVIRTVILTEVATGAGILGLLPLGPAWTYPLLPLLGVALNGTSSVLYGTVADLVTPEQRSRAYGLFYTLSIGFGAVAPFLYGFLSDGIGVPLTLGVVGVAVLGTVPLSLMLSDRADPLS